MSNKQHWEQVYQEKQPDAVSWYQQQASLSLALIQQVTSPDACLIDVGSGASTLIADLLKLGYQHLTVLDLSAAALSLSQQRLGTAARYIHWLEADITEVKLPALAYDLWHDRAVFHFLTQPAQRHAYVTRVKNSLKTGGYLVIACFADHGPEKCSGLPVQRYSAQTLAAEFGADFKLLTTQQEQHFTPFGTSQPFVYLLLQKI